MLAQPIIQQQTSIIPPNDAATLAKLPASSLSNTITTTSTAKPAKKPKKSKAKKEQTPNAQPPSISTPKVLLSSGMAQSNHAPQPPPLTSTGKLDLAK